jgi:peptidoglycan/xylan/chitin deacetylase (PgdA/CDA1 family)
VRASFRTIGAVAASSLLAIGLSPFANPPRIRTTAVVRPVHPVHRGPFRMGPPAPAHPMPVPRWKPAVDEKPDPKRTVLAIWPKARREYGPARSMASTGDSSVALTFDDGPSDETAGLLDLLARYHIKATFCLIGEQVWHYREVVRRIVREGHTLCDHSWDHDESLGRRSAATIRADMLRTNAAIHRVVPDAKIMYFRHPGGNFTARSNRICENLGMRPLFWDVDPRDWARPGVGHIESVVGGQTHRGSIVLSHDGGGDRSQTMAAYRRLLPALAHRFHLVALSTQEPVES